MRKLLIPLAVASLALTGCTSTGRISTDFDKSQSFAQYQTFAWAGERPMIVLGNRLVPPRVQVEVADAIKEDLTAKGYRYTQNLQEADFAVSFTIGTRDGLDVIEVPDYFWQSRARWAWGGAYWPQVHSAPMMRPQVREYTEGTLAIDIYDVERRAPVWHGVGTRNLSRAELQGRSNQATDAVRAILGGFPPN